MSRKQKNIMQQDWIPEIKDWEKVTLKTYDFLYKRAKEKFDEVLEDSEVLTSRTIKLLSAIVISLTYFVTLKYQDICLCLLFFIVILYMVDFIVLIKLLFPKQLMSRGTAPEDILIDGLITDKNGIEYSPLLKSKVAYYYVMTLLQRGINMNKESNRKRQELYKIAIVISTLILIMNIINYMLNHP